MQRINNHGVLYQYLFDDATHIAKAWWQNKKLREFLRENPIGNHGTSVYVFSSAGRVYQGLPNESTAIDYGYKIHSEIGNHTKRIWVNGQPTQYSLKLMNGDLIEIALDPEYQGPDVKWLGVVKSTTAVKRIKAELKKHAPHKGRQLIDKIFTSEVEHYMLGNSVSNTEFQAFLEEIATQLGYSGVNALYFDITNSSSVPLKNDKRISAERVVAKFIEKN